MQTVAVSRVGASPVSVNPLAMVRGLGRHRELILQLIGRDFAQNYRSTYLGTLWALLNPLLMLLVYTFIFSSVLKTRWDHTDHSMGMGSFALTLFAGLIPFSVFSGVMHRTPQVIVNSPNYVKKVVFPLEILPIVAVGSALVDSLIELSILAIGLAVFAGVISPTVILLPLVYLPLIFLCLGLGWFLASLGVYVRDTTQGIPAVTRILFFFTPVFYKTDAVPERLQPIWRLNPLAEIVESFRRVLIWNEAPDWERWLVVTTASAIVLLLGYAWFMKTKEGFADVI
jgi:homopolymeric O-antigen transport system permease protein